MRKIPLLLLLTLAMAITFAHEYILLAAKYRLTKGDNLEVHLFVADGFNIQIERPFQKQVTRKFELITTDSIIDLTLRHEGALPIINRPVNFSGGALIHLERDYSRISLETEKFFDYLKEDHIDGIAGQVDKTKAVQKERYSRYVKCLLQSEQVYTDSLYKKIVGQEFEIILLQNPYTLHAGDKLSAQVFYKGKPLANKIITARNRTGSEPAGVQTAGTDRNGICTITLNRKGEWFLHATYMIPCPDKQDSDWESFWASYSFAID